MGQYIKYMSAWNLIKLWELYVHKMKRCETKPNDFLCFIFIYITSQNTAKLHSNTLRAGLVPPAAAQPFRTTTSGVGSAAAWSPHPSRCCNSRSIDDTNQICYVDAHSNKQMRNGLPDYLVTGFLEAPAELSVGQRRPRPPLACVNFPLVKCCNTSRNTIW
jgi:hypothetical protein